MSSPVDEVLETAVAAGTVPGVVAVAADRNGLIYQGAAGVRVAGGDEPVSADSLYRIMSMTKMVTTVAALQLAEQGLLDLDAPVRAYRPEFAGVRVLDGFDGDTPRLRPPATEATVKHLVTHTSGLGYWFWNELIAQWERVTGTPNVLAGQRVIFDAPMTADPGTKFQYGINTDWLGAVVEAISGVGLDVYVKEHVFGPLGMDRTAFQVSDEERAGAVPIHVKDETGRWTATGIELVAEPEYFGGGHGLYSTPNDYLAFQRMLLGGGVLDGERVLGADTVAAAFTNQIGDLEFPAEIVTSDPASSYSFRAAPGQTKWGYGLLLTTEAQPGMRAAGSGSWAGLCNSHYWVDPATGITGAIYAQSLPFVPPEQIAMYADFERALYASL